MRPSELFTQITKQTGLYNIQAIDNILSIMQVGLLSNEKSRRINHISKVGRTIYQKICYVLTRNGVNTGFEFSKGSYGPFSSQVKDCITALANADLIVEKQLGRMISLSVAENVEIHKEKFTDGEWEAVLKTVDLFSRVKSTDQAEMVATVLYSYDQLSIE